MKVGLVNMMIIMVIIIITVKVCQESREPS